MRVAETIQVREDERFDAEAVESYLRERIEGLPEGELEVREFPSGVFNLTYLFKIGDWEGVLRRPPSGPVPRRSTTWVGNTRSSRAWELSNGPRDGRPIISRAMPA